MTRDEILSLSPAQLRVEVAKARYAPVEERWCIKWQDCNNCEEYQSHIDWQRVQYADIPELITDPEKDKACYRDVCYLDAEDTWKIVTDYPNDIAAAFELEGEISEFYRYAYIHCLKIAITKQLDPGFVSFFEFAHATAEQRCRAWLMWKEAK